MLYEFAEFQLDQDRRELRLRGREVTLQPKVFDVLLYLVENRARVVTKQELLSGVWSDVVVSEGSLKRAISLVRSALRQGGAEDAIRTHARQGYCFDEASVREVVDHDGASLPDRVARARQACADAEWGAAAALFREADAADGLEAADLERWGESEQFGGTPLAAVPVLERALAAHSAAGDCRGAARAALGLAHIYYERMKLSVSKGWLQRAASILSGTDRCREHGVHAGFASRFAVAEEDYDAAIAQATLAIEIAHELDDDELELLGKSYLGMALTATGDVRAGFAAHEEAAASVMAGAASPLVTGLVYCSLIWTCRNRGDWRRAGEWADSFAEWCAKASVHAFAGSCMLHHAEVLQHRGELRAAERETLRACEALSELAPYAQGDGCRVLGDLHLSKGELDEAEAAYRRAHELGWDPQPGLALTMVERGQADAAVRALARSLAGANWANRQRRDLLLAGMVTVAIAAGDLEQARTALAELETHSAADGATVCAALVRQARAEVAADAGDVATAIGQLRDAVAIWHRVGSPLRASRARLVLAQLFAADADLVAAELELTAARKYFDQIGANKLLVEVDRVQRELLAGG